MAYIKIMINNKKAKVRTVGITANIFFSINLILGLTSNNLKILKILNNLKMDIASGWLRKWDANATKEKNTINPLLLKTNRYGECFFNPPF